MVKHEEFPYNINPFTVMSSFHLGKQKHMKRLIIWLQLVRTCARYHQEKKKSEERSKKEKEIQLRHIASTIAREVEFFWSNIEQVRVWVVLLNLFYIPNSHFAINFSYAFFFQVVEIKLQFEIYEKRLKSLCIQKAKGLFRNCFTPLLNSALFKTKL